MPRVPQVGPPLVRQKAAAAGQSQSLHYSPPQLDSYYTALLRSRVGQLCTVIRSDPFGMPELDFDGLEATTRHSGDGVLYHTIHPEVTYCSETCALMIVVNN